LSAILSFSPTKDGHKVFFTAEAQRTPRSRGEKKRGFLYSLFSSLRDLGVLCASAVKGAFFHHLSIAIKQNLNQSAS
jgi:hypothetical protein